MPIVKLAPNMPVAVQAKYLDIIPGNYGPQVRVKGAFNDVTDAMMFLPGKLPDVLTALVAGGVLTQVPVTPDPLPERGFALTPSKKHFTVTLAQLAGEKYGKLSVSANGAAPEGAPVTTATAGEATPG